METILKILSIFITIVVIIDGIYVYFMPPVGDEPVAFVIIFIGILIPVITFSVGEWENRT